MAKNLNALFTEIDQITQKIHSLHLEVNQQDKRLIDFNIKIEQAKSKSHDLKAQKKSKQENAQRLENELAVKQGHLEKAQAQIETAVNQTECDALEKQIATLLPQVEQLTASVLEFMEQIELLEEEIKNIDNFLNGATQGLAEIESDVKSEKSQLNEQIIQYQSLREDELMIALSPSHKNEVKNSLAKFADKSPFAQLNGKNCRICGAQADSFQSKEIENGRDIQFCNGCERILYIAS